MSDVQKNCEACGDIITVRLADHKRGWGRFCDKACSGAHKCGQRPGDVNEGHAKKSYWAECKWNDFKAKYGDGKPPRAPKISAQIGHKVKIKPIYHSPAHCWHCGTVINGPGLCFECEAHDQALSAMEEGWDGHKNSAGAS